MATMAIGRPLARVDGRAKVTGEARFAADAHFAGLAYATIVQSTIARGTIREIDDTAARAAPGVVTILTHLHKPVVVQPPPDLRNGGITAEIRMPLADATIHHAGQHVAVVVARTLEQSRHAASLLRIAYDAEPARLDDTAPDAEVLEPPEFFGDPLQGEVGDVTAALAASDVTHTATYVTPHEHHNPIEPSGTVAVVDGDHLTVYDTTQWIVGTRAVIADMLQIPRDNVRVVCPYLGGSFGCKGMIWPHTLLAVMAAKQAGMPVKLVLTRAQMFTSCGHRTQTTQEIAIGATVDGRLTAIRHTARMPGSTVGPFVEYCTVHTSCLTYAAPNIAWKHQLVPLDLPEPNFMRAPGAAPGTFALECALDELAYRLDIDPLDLRLRNYARTHNPTTGKPFSTNHLGECYTVAAEQFGWRNRLPAPGAMHDGDLRVGWGMATAMHHDSRWGGTCRVRLTPDGKATVGTSAHEMGQGAYTALTQIAADALGLDPADVTFLLGDSDLPPGPLAAGSNTTATVSVAIRDAAAKLAERLETGGARGAALVEAVRASGLPFAEAMGVSFPGPVMEQFSFQSFGAHFVEVAIDPLLPRVRVRRVVSMLDVGRVINPRMARSQIAGAITMGIGMALTEATRYDPRTGRTVNDNLADYAVPVSADIPEIEVLFTDRPDPHFNPDGLRGLGEVGITGIAAAIANAVFHATGKRVRELPILPKTLL